MKPELLCILLYQWNKDANHTQRRMDEFLNSSNTKEFIEAIKAEEVQVSDNQVMRKITIPDNQVVIKGKVKTLKDGTKLPASIWMHPLLFIDFAMWINPTFKVKVLKFVYDEMIILFEFQECIFLVLSY